MTSVYIYKSVWDLIGIVQNLQTSWESRHILESHLCPLLILSTLALLECRLLPRDEACSAVWSLSRVETRSGQTKTRSLRRLLEGDERLWFRTLQGPRGTVIHWRMLSSHLSAASPAQPCFAPAWSYPRPAQMNWEDSCQGLGSHPTYLGSGSHRALWRRIPEPWLQGKVLPYPRSPGRNQSGCFQAPDPERVLMPPARPSRHQKLQRCWAIGP